MVDTSYQFWFTRTRMQFVSSTYGGLVFVQNLVVLAHRYAEDDRRHVLEAVDPLLTLRSLTSDVEQPASNTPHTHNTQSGKMGDDNETDRNRAIVESRIRPR